MELIQTHCWDFAEGSQIDPEIIEKWRNEVVNAFETDNELQENIHRSGNSLVIGRRVKEDSGERIEIFVIQNGYQLFTYEKSE